MTAPREQAKDITVDTTGFTKVVSPTRRLQEVLGSIDGQLGGGNPLAAVGNVVKLVYMTTAVSGVGSDGWYFPNKTAPTLTGRVASIVWEGTSAQIPAQGTGDTSFRVGDTAMVRTETL